VVLLDWLLYSRRLFFKPLTSKEYSMFSKRLALPLLALAALAASGIAHAETEMERVMRTKTLRVGVIASAVP
jgi:hypothetical protein